MRLSFAAKGPGSARNIDGWQQSIASAAQHAVLSNDPEDGTLSIEADFRLHRPSSRKRDREHQTKPDVFRLGDAVREGLRGIVYRDESAIVDMQISKRYVARGMSPSVHLVVIY